MKDFTASNFVGKCTIDEDFEPYLIKMNERAKAYGIEVLVLSSLRFDTNVKNAIVVPAKKGNHLVGHGIDCNLRWKGKYFNSVKMQSATGVIRNFINDCKKDGLRWGGDFKKRDPVHFDDGLNILQPEKYQEKYNKLHPAV